MNPASLAAVPPIRKRTKQTADRAVAAAEELLDDAGCAVNELTKNDYGFDLHVQLPDHVPDESEEGWPMSSLSALIQVKGGTYIESGVRLRRDRWEYLSGSMTPVYVAAVPEESEPWVASIEELLPLGLGSVQGDSFSAQPRQRSWAPKPFVSDALAGALLGSPRLRRWWRQLQPVLYDDDEPYDRGHELLRYLLDLEILVAIDGTTMSTATFYECEENVRALVANEHLLIEALEAAELVHRSDSGGLRLDVDLAVYVPESEFIEPSGLVTARGIEGHNNLSALGERVVLRRLTAPAIEKFLAEFDWDYQFDLDEENEQESAT
jgi:hypothetical protein